MKPEEINVVIAEACGWRIPKDFSHSGSGTSPNGNFGYYPNYGGCLNAMHEAEKTLNDFQSVQFGAAIRSILHRDNNRRNYSQSQDKIWHATVEQRAEAFLRTIDKWKETVV